VRFVICYDVTDDRRRERLASTLLDFGRRVQESVFMATLDDELFGRMMKRVEQLVDAEADTLHVLPLCAACEGKVRRLGRAELPEDKPYYIV
jgi:CRISPR-associated protein Cas2